MMRIDKKHDGQSLITWIVLTPFVLIIIGVLVTEANKAYWDYRIKGMCEKDGGVTVFETVHISKEQYEKNDGYKGMIRISPKSTTRPYHEFYSKNSDVIINESNPQVVRSEYVTYRKSDEKPLGKWVTYSRRGGDFPTGFHPSSFSCGQIINFKRNAAKEIFIIEME